MIVALTLLMVMVLVMMSVYIRCVLISVLAVFVFRLPTPSSRMPAQEEEVRTSGVAMILYTLVRFSFYGCSRDGRASNE